VTSRERGWSSDLGVVDGPRKSRRAKKPPPTENPSLEAFRLGPSEASASYLVLGAADTLKLQLAVLPVTSRFVVVSCCPR
jgi:hypothetical protein